MDKIIDDKIYPFSQDLYVNMREKPNVRSNIIARFASVAPKGKEYANFSGGEISLIDTDFSVFGFLLPISIYDEIEKLQRQICLTKPKDCYLYLVCAKGNELDCSFCNDICLDSIPQYDECELYMLEGLELDKPKIMPLHSNNAIELIQDSKNHFSGKQNTFEYNIDTHNCLCITQNNEVIIRLTNYRFYITQDSDKA